MTYSELYFYYYWKNCSRWWKTTKENELCKLKGHMWYCNKRKDVQKEDGLYSICIERFCARCGKIEEIEGEKHD